MLDEIKKRCNFIIGHSLGWMQRMVAMEECSELIQAISKYERYREMDTENIKEEIADVQVMIIQLCLMEGISKEEIEKIMMQKLDKQIERIENGQ